MVCPMTFQAGGFRLVIRTQLHGVNALSRHLQTTLITGGFAPTSSGMSSRRSFLQRRLTWVISLMLTINSLA